MLRLFFFTLVVSAKAMALTPAECANATAGIRSKVSDYFMTSDIGKKLSSAVAGGSASEKFELSFQNRNPFSRRVIVEKAAQLMIYPRNGKLVAQLKSEIEGIPPMEFDLPRYDLSWSFRKFYRNIIKPKFFAALQFEAIEGLHKQIENSQTEKMTALWPLLTKEGETTGFQLEGPSLGPVRNAGRFLLRSEFREGYILSTFIDTGVSQKAYYANTPLVSLFNKDRSLDVNFRDPQTFIGGGRRTVFAGLNKNLALENLTLSHLIGIDPFDKGFKPINYSNYPFQKVIVKSGPHAGALGRVQKANGNTLQIRLSDGDLVLEQSSNTEAIFDYLLDQEIDPVTGLKFEYYNGERVIYKKTETQAKIITGGNSQSPGFYEILLLDASGRKTVTAADIIPVKYFITRKPTLSFVHRKPILVQVK
jgi:hypothetical protein